MTALSRVRWWVLLGLTLLANLPNLLPWERELYPTTYMIDLQERWFFCLPITVLMWSFFKRLDRAWLFLWIVCLWWLPVSLAVRYVNNTTITSALIGIASESTPGELMEFLQSLPADVYALCIGLNAVFFLVYMVLRRVGSWRFSGKERLLMALPGLLVIAIAFPGVGADVQAGSTRIPVSADQFDPQASGGLLPSRLALTFPTELGVAISEHLDAQASVEQAVARMQSSRYVIRPKSPAQSPQLVVLLIGESSSRQDWRLFESSSAPTTPKLDARLAKDPGLFRLTNVVAQSTATRYAVPGMLTDRPLFWPDGKGNPQATRSIVAMAAQAGYRTGWYSNQTAGGKFDGPLAVYAKEAASIAFLNPSNFLQRGTYDEVLLPLLSRHIQRHDKAFVVMHTLGSHFHFSHRYPPAFERFLPAESPFLRAPEGSANQGLEATANAYRNSVLYTDHVIEEVISKLEATGRSAVLVYVSDHGQGVGEPGCDKQPLNRSMARAYEVPALVWASAKYQQDNPEMVSLLQQNESAPFTTQAIYQSLIDLMEGDVRSFPEGETSRPSFLRQPMPDSRQMVVSPLMQWVDFAAASGRSRCVIAPVSSKAIVKVKP